MRELLPTRRRLSQRLTAAAGAAVVLAAAVVVAAPAVVHASAHHARPVKLRPASVVQTTATLTNALTPQAPLPFATRPAPGAEVIEVNPGIRYQRMIGFGAAMTDSSAWLLYQVLTPAQQAATMQALFSPAGIDLNYVRIPIAASDYVAFDLPYSYDDTPSGQTDPTLSDFSVAHDDAYILPALREMLAINPHVWTMADPWSAPPWMKTNLNFNNEGLLGNVLPQDYPALAEYFVKFIEAYQAAGVPIDAITPMNEPNSRSGWPGTHLTPADDATFLPDDLVPALRRAGLHPAIYGPDGAEASDARALLSGPARRDLAGAAFHCYHRGMGYFSAIHREFPSKPILLTECSPGIIPYATAEVPIDAARNWASGVQLWNLALDTTGGPVESNYSYGCHGCTGVVTINTQTRSTIYNLNYYEFGQTSKYVQPGAVRIFSTRFVRDLATGDVSPGLDDVAFTNPNGSTALVAYNSAPEPAQFAVHYKCRYLNWTLAPDATVTLVWRWPSGFTGCKPPRRARAAKSPGRR